MVKLHKYSTMLDAVTATGSSLAFDVSDYKNVAVTLAGADTSVMTVKFQGALGLDEPDFSAAQSPSNLWDYVQVLDMESGDAVDGDTGVSVLANGVSQYEVNTENLQYLGVTVTAYTSGEVTAKLSASNNK